VKVNYADNIVSMQKNSLTLTERDDNQGMYFCLYSYTYYRYIPVCMFVCVFILIYIHIYIHIYIPVYTHTHINTRTHINTHTHIKTH
jgi:hypothetical protein